MSAVNFFKPFLPPNDSLKPNKYITTDAALCVKCLSGSPKFSLRIRSSGSSPGKHKLRTVSSKFGKSLMEQRLPLILVLHPLAQSVADQTDVVALVQFQFGGRSHDADDGHQRE